MRSTACILTASLTLLACATEQAPEPADPTARWWSHIEALAGDDMRGRDTGTPEHRRAQEYVVDVLSRNGVMAAGEDGYFQPVPIRSYRLDTDTSTASLTRDGGDAEPLRWMQHITVGATLGLPDAVRGPLVFAGSDNAAGLDTAGAVVVYLNPVRLVGAPPLPEPPAGAVATLAIDSAVGPEPARWPAQYSVSMALADTGTPTLSGLPAFRFNPAFADVLLEGTGHTYAELVSMADWGDAVTSFAIPATLDLTLDFEGADLVSDNVIGVLPGSDPALAGQYVVVSAHVDGYGLGYPWDGDAIYNGAFDDAAYVATLLDFAEALRESGTTLRRSLLFAVYTGEEKGLLGSRYFTTHLTVPRESLVADVNLDQLRPVFPLHTLTMHAVNDSTLGATARQVAAGMDIRIQEDPEPLRNLNRRTDHFPFLQIGVPATGFVFGFEPGTPDEEAYRQWYRDRYHTPLDDLTQPWLPDAAARFNEFFARFVTAVADADEAPAWLPGSQWDSRRPDRPRPGSP